MSPRFAQRYKVVTFDLVGCGKSDLASYDSSKYATLDGYASDLLEIIDEIADGPVIFVGHSVSAMIGLIADLKSPGSFAAHCMIGPSPCYVNQGDYVGGFEREDIDSLLDALESIYLGWASTWRRPSWVSLSARPFHRERADVGALPAFGSRVDVWGADFGVFVLVAMGSAPAKCAGHV